LDGAVDNLNGHTPAGALRGGKYSLYEGGTRVPFIANWPGRIKPGVSNELVSQIDLMASFAALTGQKLSDDAGPDIRPRCWLCVR
jgi:arylsulfatase A-like enzyme